MKFTPLVLKDAWLSTVNPLRGLTMGRVVAELEAGQRGEYSMLQWLYHYIEKRDATLRGAKRRIRSSLLKLDWDVKIQSDLSPADQAAAEKQRAALKAEYEKVGNLRQALAHLAGAEFRGFAHLEKHFDGESVVRLEPVPQWHWCRDGFYGEWMFQEDALRGGIQGVPIDPAAFVIREVEDPIDEIALICFVRKSLSQKDWDSFVARYGIPFVFWILSEPMAAALANEPEKIAEWMQVMRGIGSDGEGIIPGGSLETLSTSGGGTGENQFSAHLKCQDEQIVMAATSGKLTMLNEATGLGSGNSEAHGDTFDEIALALAMEISETLQEQLDTPVLERLFPGQKRLVYFELAAKDAEDVEKLVQNVKTLKDAGWEIDGAELNERTGYTLTRKEATASDSDPVDPADPEKDDEGAGKMPALPPKKAGSKNRVMKKSAMGLLSGFNKLAAAFLAESSADIDALFAAAATGGETSIPDDEA